MSGPLPTPSASPFRLKRVLPVVLAAALVWAACDSSGECALDSFTTTPFQVDYTADLSGLPVSPMMEVVLVFGPGAPPSPVAPTVVAGSAGALTARVNGRAETSGAPPNLRPAVHIAEGRVYLWFSTEPAAAARSAFLPACDPIPEGYYAEGIRITAPPGVEVTFRTMTVPSGGPWTAGRPASVLT
jgi:hypothetical protein